MADIFISFKTDDTPRVQAIYDGFRARGLTVFWSNDIPKGAPNYQAIIKDELLKAPAVVVVWTNFSVHSGPVVQECSQAERANKLFQILLDDIEPIDMPMEVKFKAQKTMLLGWTGNRSHSEWVKLNSAIDVRLGRTPQIMPNPAGTFPQAPLTPALSPRGEGVRDGGSGVPSPQRGEGQGEWALPPQRAAAAQAGSQGGGGWLDRVKTFVAGPAGGQAPAASIAGDTPAQRTRPSWASDAGEDKFGLWADFALGDVRQRMRWIKPGTFQMGSPEGEDGRYGDEGPQHEVTLTKGFWFGDTPVTQSLWTAAMGNNPSNFKDPKRPVESVSWDDAQQFLNKMNARIPGLRLELPTEAQWEYACRAHTNGPNYAGDAGKLAEIAWFSGNSGGQTHPVATKRGNDWGLYDMLGNVWEWCVDGNRSYSAKPVTDPAGPVEGASRALRGGSWSDYARYLRAACRLGRARGHRYYGIGFRCCA
jgi:formylglycine-generating enzyme required for sulfatase activity